MRTSVDALRSVRRWFGQVLDGYEAAKPGPDVLWDIRYTRSEEMVRPSGTVATIGPQPNTGSAWVRDVTRDLEIFLYPLGVEGDVSASKLEAESVAAFVEAGLTRGFVPPAGEARSYSMRIPVFDYDAIPITQGVVALTAPYDYLVIQNVSVEPRVDPDQDDLFTVIVDLRAHWRTDGDTRRFEGADLLDVFIGDPTP